MNKNNYVMSYFNPDTDGVACSIALAGLLSRSPEVCYRPVIWGSINRETEYVLSELKIKTPGSVTTIKDADSIALVDTHHKTQLPLDFPYDKVDLIVDHHPKGDDDLFVNAKIYNKPIGAAASIIAEMYLSEHIYDSKMLPLLGMAIVSNTLNFIAPSASEYDRNIFNEIHNLYPLSDTFISNMLMQRSSIMEKGLKSALESDFKVFETKRGLVGIAQLEVYNLIAQIDCDEVSKILLEIADERKLQFCFFNGVDMKEKKSLVVCADDKAEYLAGEVFKVPFNHKSAVFDRVLLRKTDFIPLLNK